MQESCPEKENSPAGHCEHGEPPGPYVPAGQVMEQEAAPAVEEVPPLQAAHE